MQHWLSRTESSAATVVSKNCNLPDSAAASSDRAHAALCVGSYMRPISLRIPCLLWYSGRSKAQPNKLMESRVLHLKAWLAFVAWDTVRQPCCELSTAVVARSPKRKNRLCKRCLSCLSHDSVVQPDHSKARNIRCPSCPFSNSVVHADGSKASNIRTGLRKWLFVCWLIIGLDALHQ